MSLLAMKCPCCSRIGAGPCSSCRAAIEYLPHLDDVSVLSAMRYNAKSRRVVTALKNANQRSALAWCVNRLLFVLREYQVHVDAVTWLPTTVRRARKRGFDQSQLLASRVARELEMPAVAMLNRLDTLAQAGRSLDQRLNSPQFGPTANALHWQGCRVLVIDDVWTTGSSMRSACLILSASAMRTVPLVLLRRVA